MSWGRYLDGIAGRWAFRHERLRLPKGQTFGQALPADPWQRELWDLFDGPASVVMICGSRGTAKTTVSAGLGVERLCLRRRHDVVIVANDEQQARIAFDEACGFAARDPQLKRVLEPFRSEIRNPAIDARLRVITSDAVSSYGLGLRPTTFIYDEIWGVQKRELLDALLSALPKQPGSQLIALTNAGFFDTPAHELWKLCDGSDPAFVRWDSVERGAWPSWIPREELERQRKLLPASVFERLWLNRWTSGAGDFLLREQIEACVDEKLDPHAWKFDPLRRYYLGIDLGLRHDRSVVCVGHRERETFVLDHVRTWYGTPERPVSLEEVQAHVHLLGSRIRRLGRGLVDPWQAAQMLERARRAGLRSLEEFTFTPQNLQLLSQSLWNAFRSQTIRVPAYEPLVDELVALRVVEKRYGWRLDHQSGGFSDHAIALGLALVAAQPDSGEIVSSRPGDEALIAAFRERVRNAKRFGFGKRLGLELVQIGEPPGEDYEAAARLTQLLQRNALLSDHEADAIRRGLRQELLARDDGPRLLRAFECIASDDWLEVELGRVADFYRNPGRAVPITGAAAPQQETTV